VGVQKERKKDKREPYVKKRKKTFDEVFSCGNKPRYFDVLLTVHLSIFISVFNQVDAQNLFHNKFYFMPLHVSSTLIGVVIPGAVYTIRTS